MNDGYTLLKKLVAEGTGTAFLLAAVVGSGIMAERLSAGNVSLALLENTVATGAALVALILAFGPISGAHFNPAVTVADATQGGLSWRFVPGYVSAQCIGGLLGVYAAHLMFGQSVFQVSGHMRSGGSQLFSEFVATFGLLAVIWGCSRTRPAAIPFAVGAYIAAAYWFTASTSFANPAVTLARSFSNTFAGILVRSMHRDSLQCNCWGHWLRPGCFAGFRQGCPRRPRQSWSGIQENGYSCRNPKSHLSVAVSATLPLHRLPTFADDDRYQKECCGRIGPRKIEQRIQDQSSQRNPGQVGAHGTLDRISL